MWHTAEDIGKDGSGCNDTEFDCASTYVCTALKCWHHSCSQQPTFADSHQERVKAAECLRSKCPTEAAQADQTGATTDPNIACPDGTKRLLSGIGEEHV